MPTAARRNIFVVFFLRMWYDNISENGAPFAAQEEDNMSELQQTSPQSGGEEKKPRVRGSGLYDLAASLASAVLIVSLAFTFLFQLSEVDGHSMLQTLQHGDCLMVVRAPLCGGYERGDIVVARKESFMEECIVKRVIATGGQTVDIDFNRGIVYVDGAALEEDYINDLTYSDEGLTLPVTLGENEVFLMGDNRNHSTDSRSPRLGPVDKRYLVGKAVLLLIPGEDVYTGERELSRIGLLTDR